MDDAFTFACDQLLSSDAGEQKVLQNRKSHHAQKKVPPAHGLKDSERKARLLVGGGFSVELGKNFPRSREFF